MENLTENQFAEQMEIRDAISELVAKIDEIPSNEGKKNAIELAVQLLTELLENNG